VTDLVSIIKPNLRKFISFSELEREERDLSEILPKDRQCDAGEVIVDVGSAPRDAHKGGRVFICRIFDAVKFGFGEGRHRRLPGPFNLKVIVR